MKTKRPFELSNSKGQKLYGWFSSESQALQSAMAEHLAGDGPVFCTVQAIEVNPEWIEAGKRYFYPLETPSFTP